METAIWIMTTALYVVALIQLVVVKDCKDTLSSILDKIDLQQRRKDNDPDR